MKRLRMRYAIPFYLEKRLCDKFGFEVESKKFNDSIVFVKTKKKNITPAHIHVAVDNTKPKQTITFSPALDEKEKTKLEQQCDAIVDFFPDPYKAIPAVRQRLHNMSQGKSLAARQFVLEYMDENFPQDYIGRVKA